jgi:hypothetical protein
MVFAKRRKEVLNGCGCPAAVPGSDPANVGQNVSGQDFSCRSKEIVLR